MKLKRGDMWEALWESDLFCLTINRTLTPYGNLVMGAGIAKEAKKRFPMLSAQFGALIADGINHPLLTVHCEDYDFGGFVVKEDWRKPATLQLITSATDSLRLYAQENPEARIHLNFPGIGYGGLPRHQVLPIIERLPDNCTIWEY